MENQLVEVDQLKIRFPVRDGKRKSYITPVDHVSFTIRKGEVLALVGESGSGKSTIGRTLVRILDPTEGSISVEGQNINHIKGRELRKYRGKAQMIFQDPFGSLNPVRTVEKHVTFPLKKYRGCRGAELDKEIDSLFKRVGLTPVSEMRKKYPHELSGGQRQRLAIARTLAANPKFMVADEPTSMLDVSIRAGILELLNELKHDMNLSYLYITHDLASARYFGDRIMVMYGGKVMEIAESKTLIQKPLHPYTQLLLAATPGSSSELELSSLSNEAPDLSEGRQGCPFAHRCPLATNICKEEMPPLEGTAESEHFVACHHAGGDFKEAFNLIQ
ncbi:MAG TPA: ABC transporter ATP-binding protein [Bacillales bacterium]